MIIKQHNVLINTIQAQVILDNLKSFVEENKSIEQDINCDDEERKALREERLETEMLIQQLEALEW